MHEYLIIFLITALTGVGGLALGGGFAAAIHSPSERSVSLLLRFTAGVMISVVCFDLIADATEDASIIPVVVWILVGYFFTYLLNCWIDKQAHHSHSHGGHDDHEHHGHHEHDHDDHHQVCDTHEDHTDPRQEMCACGHHTLHTAGLVLAAAVALHNMPVGMAIGATFAGAAQAASGAGILAALIIGLHNLPEGMSIAAPLLSSGSKPAAAIGVAAVSGIPTILGAMLGYSLGTMNPTLLCISLSFASGAMLYVIFGELLPESEHLWQSKLSGLATMLGFLLGLVLIFSHHH